MGMSGGEREGVRRSWLVWGVFGVSVLLWLLIYGSMEVDSRQAWRPGSWWVREVFSALGGLCFYLQFAAFFIGIALIAAKSRPGWCRIGCIVAFLVLNMFGVGAFVRQVERLRTVRWPAAHRHWSVDAVGEGLLAYAAEHGGRLPEKEYWRAAAQTKGKWGKFCWPEPEDAQKRPRGLAFNESLSGVAVKSLPENTVVLFEATERGCRAGGKEQFWGRGDRDFGFVFVAGGEIWGYDFERAAAWDYASREWREVDWGEKEEDELGHRSHRLGRLLFWWLLVGCRV